MYRLLMSEPPHKYAMLPFPKIINDLFIYLFIYYTLRFFIVIIINFKPRNTSLQHLNIVLCSNAHAQSF